MDCVHICHISRQSCAHGCPHVSDALKRRMIILAVDGLHSKRSTDPLSRAAQLFFCKSSQGGFGGRFQTVVFLLVRGGFQGVWRGEGEVGFAGLPLLGGLH